MQFTLDWSDSAFAGSQRFGPYTFTQQSGTFPPGLAMNKPRFPIFTTGVIMASGTPTGAGTFTSVWRATDITGAFADATVKIIVQPVQFHDMTMPGGLLGSPYTFTLTDDYGASCIAAAGHVGVAPYTYGPPEVFGGFAVLADFNITFTVDTFSSPGLVSTFTNGLEIEIINPVTDSAGNHSSAPFSHLYLAAAKTYVPLAISASPAPPVASLRTFYSHVFPITAGVPPYNQITLASGTLPPGLTLRPRDVAALTGIPTTLGSYTFSVQVEDSFGDVATTGPVTIIVTAPGIQGTQPGFISERITGGGTL